MFCSVDFLRTYGWDTTSQIALRDCSKDVKEEPVYVGVFA